MKYPKMLGLAALAAMAVMAFIGAGTASAKICSTAGVGAGCGVGHGSVYTGPIHATLEAGEKAVLTSGFITVSCTESTVHGEITSGEETKGFLDAVTFGGCTANTGGACTANTSASAANHWPAKAFHGAKAPNGNLTVTNVTGSFTCTVFGSPVTCRYTASDAGGGKEGKDEIIVTGGEPATINAITVALTKEEVSGGLCSNTATWSAKYWLTTPSSLFIT